MEPSDYTLRNVGDMAMLETAVHRMIRLYPDATVTVLTHDPSGLQELCPEVDLILGGGRDI